MPLKSLKLWMKKSMKSSKFQTRSALFISFFRYILIMYIQLERLNQDTIARTKRERRRANEIKTRTIQRMQLQMTAPLDIGMEQQDAALGLGQDDMFGLQITEDGMRRKQRLAFLTQTDGDILADTDDEENTDVELDEALDSEEENEKRTANLEVEMDGLYELYQERLRDRDAKYKVKESRQKNAEREEWHGIVALDGDSEDESEGGWDVVQEAKKNADVSEDESSDSDSDVDMDNALVAGRKRTRVNVSQTKSSKRARLLTKLEQPKSQGVASATTKLWFSQEVFAGVEDIDAVNDDKNENDEDNESQWSEENDTVMEEGVAVS